MINIPTCHNPDPLLWTVACLKKAPLISQLALHYSRRLIPSLHQHRYNYGCENYQIGFI